MWAARDKDGSLWLYTSKPNRQCIVHRWTVENVLLTSMRLREDIFPSLKWENEPVEVKIIRRENNLKNKMYIAIDKDGYLSVHTAKPIRYEDRLWVSLFGGSLRVIGGSTLMIDRNLFTDLKWEDEPIEVELIKKKSNETGR